MGNSRKSRAALEMVNSDEFKRIINTEEINVAELTELLVDSRLSDTAEEAGYVFAWEDYVLVVDSSVSANVSNPAAMMELLQKRGLMEAKDE